MNILQLCNKPPFPPLDGGAIAIFNLSLAYALEGHQVSILAMNTDKHEQDIKSLPSYKNIEFSYIPVDSEIKWIDLIKNLLFSKKPYNAQRFESSSFSIKLREHLKNNEYDIIQLEGLYLKPYIQIIRKHSIARIIYRAHNIESDIWNGLAQNCKNPLKRFYLNNLAKRIRQYEKNFIDLYDIVLPISEIDQVKLNEMGNTKPSFLTYTGLPEDKFYSPEKNAAIKSIFFIGALDWLPNQEGLLWFMEQVWPEVQKRSPEIEFHIAGRNAPEWLSKKCRKSKAIYHGEIEDAEKFFDQHDIMIVPLFSGSGLRIKIIEAFARSKVVITTPVGIRGLNLSHNIELLISENPVEIAKEVNALRNDPYKYNLIRENAFTFAKNNFSNKRIAHRLINFFKEQGLC